MLLCNTNVSYAFFLWTQPHPGTDIEDEEGNPGSDRNEEGRHQCVEDTDLDERGYDVEITDTEASDDLLYEEVLTVVCNSLYTNTHFFFFQGY